MEINGKITVLINPDYTEIQIFDEEASVKFATITLTPEQLSSALSRLTHTPCKIETNNLDKVEKKMIHKIFDFEAVKALFLFKPYTIYPRWFEIALGIISWLNLIVFLFTLFIAAYNFNY